MKAGRIAGRRNISSNANATLTFQLLKSQWWNKGLHRAKNVSCHVSCSQWLVIHECMPNACMRVVHNTDCVVSCMSSVALFMNMSVPARPHSKAREKGVMKKTSEPSFCWSNDVSLNDLSKRPPTHACVHACIYVKNASSMGFCRPRFFAFQCSL